MKQHNIQCFTQHPQKKVSHAFFRSLVTRVLQGENWKDAVVLNIVYVDETEMQRLNAEYTGKKASTDVLAFNLSEPESELEGEVYINLNRAAEQAHDYSVPFDNEVQRLTIHGVLHLLGYNDDIEENKKRMKEREDFYLESDV